MGVMGFTFLFLFISFGAGVVNSEPYSRLVLEPSISSGLADTERVLVFVIFRHGDRTPDIEELDIYPAEERALSPKVFWPFGLMDLTNIGKQRAFLVGEYLRQSYDGLISTPYLQNECTVRTTDFSRTKMTALCALAALYPPPPSQKWNPVLDWQPVPYDTLPEGEDDLLYWYNCPRYLWLEGKLFQKPEVKRMIEPYNDLFSYLSEKTNTNVTILDVYYLDNLFQTLQNVGVPPPKWAVDVMPKIKEVTKIGYALELYNAELIRLSTGVLFTEILNATSSFIRGDTDQPKLRLYSAHENNVAALMAAARVFKPHQPDFGATFALELRKNIITGQYGFTAVYSPKAGGPGRVMPVDGCGGGPFCDYETFLELTQEYTLTKEEYSKQCFITD